MTNPAEHDPREPAGASGVDPGLPAAPALRPRLCALDIGGVILAQGLVPILKELAARSGASEPGLRDFFGQTLRDDLWSGRMSEPEFWERILRFAGLDHEDAALWRRRLHDRLTPLPAALRVGEWATQVPVVFLSNHRHEWCVPRLEALGIAGDPGSRLISSLTGNVKPGPEAVGSLLTFGVAPERILFVDDRPNNLRSAAAIGIQTLFAGEPDRWIPELDRRLALAG